DKLPPEDKPVIEGAIRRYDEWVKKLRSANGSSVDDLVKRMVALLNDYRLYLDVEVIFDREADFLYRQKGQTKLDNSVIEEFLPHLVYKCVMRDRDTTGIAIGPNTTFSSIYFASSLDAPAKGGGITVRTKDQDFAIGKAVYLRASHDEHFKEATTKALYVGYVCAECKTNLDKTMFQEAVATAHDTKAAVTGAKYFLLCEWLDMLPQSTAPTDIDEVIILRKQKRMSSNVRASFGTSAGRKAGRKKFLKFLQDNPFNPDMFLRFVNHLSGLFGVEEPEENTVLKQGYF
ncbi:MAG TPA: Bpu10I family restriction endonuclease, partial [Pirellulales bacterium]|nr:Bpu10I family restriction endonuclease [Pirellulales bacterium]